MPPSLCRCPGYPDWTHPVGGVYYCKACGLPLAFGRVFGGDGLQRQRPVPAGVQEMLDRSARMQRMVAAFHQRFSSPSAPPRERVWYVSGQVGGQGTGRAVLGKDTR